MEPAARARVFQEVMNGPTLAYAAGFDLRSCFAWLQLLFAIFFSMATLPGRTFAVTQENLDESRVPTYVLPDPLVAAGGSRITTADEWISKRRPEILRLFETEVYGRAPAQKPELRF